MGGFLMAQTPQKMSYQAVIRDGGGQLIKDRNIGMQISVLQGSESGTAVFVERFFPTTNTNGLVTVEIGGGLSVNGSFSGIDWSAGPYFVKTETDINGGANYSISATSQLLSIPYALMAKNVENVPSLKMDDLTDVDAVNIQAGQLLKWDGTNWKPANDATTGGPGTTYTPGSGISIDVNNVISNTGDLSNTNEIQQLEIAGDQLKLTGANTVTLPTVTTYTAGPGISLNNNTITNTGDNDNDADNELQQLTLSGTVLTLSQNGGSVTLPTSGGGGGDNWGTQTVVTDNTTIEGEGTPASPLKLDNQNATNGQVLKSNGNTWIPGQDNDNQNLSVSGNSLTITNGNTITLPADGDGSPTNEIQTLSLSGANINLSNGGGSIVLPDASATNEIQTIGLAGANVNLSNGGGSITLPDASASNEIQTLSISGQNLTLSSGGGTVELPMNNGLWRNIGNNITTESPTGFVGIGGFGDPDYKLKVTGDFSCTGNARADEIFGGIVRVAVNGTFILNAGARVQGSLIPIPFGTYDIGSTDKKWNNIYAEGIIGAKSEGDWLPSTNGTVDLGSTNAEWDKVYANTIVNAKSEGDWLPTANGSMDLGSTSFEWDNLYVNTIVGPANLDGHIIPVNGSQSDLGSATKKFRDIYVNSLISGAGNIEITSDLTSFNCSGDFNPDATNQNDLGSSSKRWKKLYTNTAVDISSDKRLKENIKPIRYGLQEVLQLKPVSYIMKEDKDEQLQLGYLAQDLKKVIPTVVHGDENKEMLSVTYSELIPVLTKAIQEQQVMIDQQNKTIDALIKRIEMLENK
ncbi:MAG: tail fiber domain-containing protein [Saprospiraceae bacterium]|nr:tail fiber domain-containing protein [Saprospiraceae bacterium]